MTATERKSVKSDWKNHRNKEGEEKLEIVLSNLFYWKVSLPMAWGLELDGL